ncbi:MAG: fatty acid desaturase [Deltaproteobacteria bacterium]|nr:fatty acid desaturase [Deltaproteobacteria bacterium]
MKFFRYKEDIVPTALIVALFVLDLVVFFVVENISILIVWLVLTALPKIFICSWNHHHQHLPTFHQKLLNRALEIVYAFHTGITTNAWVLHHVLGHHLNYLDQTRDESGWKRKDGAVMSEAEYTWTIAVTGYLRAFRVGLRHPKIQRGFIGMGALVLVLLSGFVYLNPLNALTVFMIPMLVGYVVTCWHTYYHHAGLDTDDHFKASHNIMHSWYNLFTGNLGYHTAHHIKPGLHWSRLPEFHATIADKIPPELYVEPFVPLKWLPCKNSSQAAS